MGIVSNLSKTRLQKYSALKHVSEFKEMFNPGKLASTAKMEPKQIIFKKPEANKLYEFYQVEPPFGELEAAKTIDHHYRLKVAPDAAL